MKTAAKWSRGGRESHTTFYRYSLAMKIVVGKRFALFNWSLMRKELNSITVQWRSLADTVFFIRS